MSRVAKNSAAYSAIGRWFNSALKRHDPRPAADVMDRLARELQILLNRANNAEHRRAGTLNPGTERDVSLDEWLQRRTRKLGDAAKALVEASYEYERDVGTVVQCPDRDWSMEELQEMLLGMSALAGPRNPSTTRLGRRPVPWKDAARRFGRLVAVAMREAGYSGRLEIADPESVTAIVTAAAISWAYNKKLTPEGLVTNMRDRQRGNLHSSRMAAEFQAVS